MDRTCSFQSCVSRTRHRRHGVILHEYPTSEEIRAKWLAVVRHDRREPRWTPSPDSRVCSLHFGKAQFLSKRVLHARAVPSAKIAVPKFMQRAYNKRGSEEQDEMDADLDNEIPTDAEFQIVEEAGPADEEMAEPERSDPKAATAEDAAVGKRAAEDSGAEPAGEPIATVETADGQKVDSVEESVPKLPAAEKVPTAKETAVTAKRGEVSKVKPPAAEDADVDVAADHPAELITAVKAPEQAELLPTEPAAEGAAAGGAAAEGAAAEGPAVSDPEAEPEDN